MNVARDNERALRQTLIQLVNKDSQACNYTALWRPFDIEMQHIWNRASIFLVMPWASSKRISYSLLRIKQILESIRYPPLAGTLRDTTTQQGRVPVARFQVPTTSASPTLFSKFLFPLAFPFGLSFGDNHNALWPTGTAGETV